MMTGINTAKHDGIVIRLKTFAIQYHADIGIVSGFNGEYAL